MATCEKCGAELHVGDYPFCPHGEGGMRIRTDEKFIGGMVIRNLGHRPVTVYSEQERQSIMKARGLRDCTAHDPIPGTDKSPHTMRFDGLLSPVSEVDRLRRWHEHEAELAKRSC